MLIGLEARAIERVVRLALEEDSPWGDLTSLVLVPETSVAEAQLVAREPGVMCGGEVFATAMGLTDPFIGVTMLVADGEVFAKGAVLASISGPARGVLTAERVALNFVQRMSGIATLTAKYVAEITGTRARIVDTRKTTPGLRVIERYAVRCGGGVNHRFSLSDAVMAKDNHLAVIRESGISLTEALLDARKALPHTVHLEVEVDRMDQIEEVLAAGVDTIMLDNFSIENLVLGVKQVAGRALVEASGGVSLETVGAIARTGVDVISVGALTHSVRSLDLGLDMDVRAGA